MTDDRPWGWIERLACRLGLATPLDPTTGLVFVLAPIGALASLAGAVLAIFVESPSDWVTVRVLAGQSGLFATAFALLRAGRVTLSAWTLLLTGVVGTTAIMFTGSTAGFDDIGIMLYAVLAIGASILFEGRNLVFSQILVLSSLLSILAAELLGFNLSGERPGSVVADAGFALLIVVVTGAGAYFLAASLRRSAAEREELIRELEMRNSELERFAYTISHELKSPLVTIGGFLPRFRSSVEAGEDEEAENAFEHIRTAHGRMTRLLSELLELCRLGFLPNAQELVRLGEVAGAAREVLGSSMELGEAQVTIGDDLPALHGDRRRLLEVFQNLLDNAVRFTRDRPEPRIEIGVRGEGAEAVVTVSDNGMGIEPRFHDKIFELFERLDATEPGTGVGLAIVRRIVELHQGRIWVESEGLGRGTTFCLWMPWAPAGAVDEPSG